MLVWEGADFQEARESRESPLLPVSANMSVTGPLTISGSVVTSTFHLRQSRASAEMAFS